MRRIPLAALLLLLSSACGTGDGDGTPDAGGGTPDAGPQDGTGPISAPARTWTWVPFSASRCMNGTPTGIGVNLNPGSDKVLIYLAGGGACFNTVTCFGVANRNGYGEAEFQNEVPRATNTVLDVGAAENPFRDWNLVYVPYCSGDVHAGQNPASSTGFAHLGYQNIGVYLTRLVPTFQNASLVVLGGSSAGGVGAAFNYDRVAQAFGSVPVQMLDDSGPVLSDTYLRPCLQKLWRSVWSLDASLPADCSACKGDPAGGGLVNLLPYLAQKYPTRRFGLVSSTGDSVFRGYFGFGNNDCASPQTMPADVFRAGLLDLRSTMSAFPNFSLYAIDTTEHVFLDASFFGTSVGGTQLTDWSRAVGEGGSAFKNVGP